MISKVLARLGRQIWLVTKVYLQLQLLDRLGLAVPALHVRIQIHPSLVLAGQVPLQPKGPDLGDLGPKYLLVSEQSWHHHSRVHVS